MKGFIRMVRDVSDVAYDASAATIINANAISSIQESQTWEETTIGTTKLLEPSANDISGLLFGNTIIQGTDLSGIIIGDNNQALNEYSIALGQGANASGTAGFVYRDRDNNTFVFDSGGSTGAGNLLINGTNPAGGGGTLPQDIPNNLDVSGTIEVSGIILPAVHSAEGSLQSVNMELDPSKNPLMTKGMLWINEAQDESSGWSAVSSLPTISNATNSQRGAVLGGKLYISTGFSGNGSTGSVAGLYVFDPNAAGGAGVWTTLSSTNPLPTSDGTIVAMGGKLYYMGGWWFPTGIPPAVETNACYVYDPSLNTWSSIASYLWSDLTIGMQAVACGGKIYCIGGFNSPYQPTNQNTKGQVYDPIDNSWNYIAPGGGGQCVVGAIGGKIYMVVEYGASVYDPEANSWTAVAGPGVNRVMSGGTTLGGKFYVMGGRYASTGTQPPSTSPHYTGEVYDPQTNTWSALPNDPTGRLRFAMGAIGGKIYIAGGCTWYANPSNSCQNTMSVRVYDPSLVQMPQITHQGEDFYLSAQRGGPKTFVIPHPEHEGKMLRHACLEAPTRGTNVYEYQFEATEDNQTTEIDLPSYFKHINGRPRVYVSASEQNGWGDCRGAVNDELTTAIIETEKSGIYNVMITGVRKDPEAVAYSATENIDEPIDAKDI